MKHNAAAARAIIQSPALAHYGMPEPRLNLQGHAVIARALGAALGSLTPPRIVEAAEEEGGRFLRWPTWPSAVCVIVRRQRAAEGPREVFAELRPEHFDFITPGSTHHA